jgi:hypothetical protein
MRITIMLVGMLVALTGCKNVDEVIDFETMEFNFENLIPEQPKFDWAPEPEVFQQNIRDCRSQPVCRAETLFRVS